MKASIGAIILAAGQSSRMGRPKLLLPWGGTTVLGQVVTAFSTADLREIVVVTGTGRERIEAHVAELAKAFPTRAIYNPGHRAGGMLGSVQAGLAGLDPGVDAALIGLGDQPQVMEDIIRSICAAFQKSASRLIIPSFQNRRGHPWLVARSLWPEILTLPATATLRDFLAAHAAGITYVKAGDDSILLDLDTPEAYERQRPPT